MKKILYIILLMVITSLASVSAVRAQWDIGLNNIEESQLPGSDTTTATITAIVMMIMKWMLGIVGFIGIIGFAISGILYLTAAGDETKIETAKKAMTWSIVGVMVALMGFVIMQAVALMLTGGRSDF